MVLVSSLFYIESKKDLRPKKEGKSFDQRFADLKGYLPTNLHSYKINSVYLMVLVKAPHLQRLSTRGSNSVGVS